MLDKAFDVVGKLTGAERQNLDHAIRALQTALAARNGAQIELAYDRLADMLFDIQMNRK